MRPAKFRLTIGLGAIGIAGALIVVAATPWGIGISPDSASYLGGARSLMDGHGFSGPTDTGSFAPIIHYPPLYSLALAMFGMLSADPLQGARWLAALLFACNVVLAGAIGFFVSQSNRLALILGLFSLVALPMVQVHTIAWSEPLFIFSQLAGMLAMVFYLRDGNRRDLILAAAAFGCGTLVRYAGLATLFAGIAGILLLSQRNGRERLIDTISLVAIGLLPMLVWAARNLWVAGSLVNRAFSVHLMSGEQIAAVFRVLSGWLSFVWLASFDLLGVSLTGLTLAGAAWVCLGLWRRQSSELSHGGCYLPAVKFFIIVVFIYVLVLLGAVSFFDAWVPIDTRLLSPLYVPLAAVCLSVGAALWRRARLGKVSSAIAVLCLMATLAAQAASSMNWLKFSYQFGVGYAGRQWRNSETLAKLGLLPTTSIVYSNAPDVLYILRGTPATMIPRKVDPHTARPNQRFKAEMAQMKRRLSEDKAMLVFFNQINWRWYLPSAEEVEKAIGMPPSVQAGDGLIFLRR